MLWDSTYFGYLLTHSSSLAEDQDGDILLMADKTLSNKPKAVFTKSGDRNDQKTWPVDKLQPGSASICPKCPPNSLDFFATAVPSPAGGYFLGGFCSQAFMDNSGKLLWCKKLENYEVYRVIRQIPTSDGGVVTLWQGTKDFPRAVISRFSNSGAPEWVKPIDGQKSKVPLDLYKDNQEQYMILGIHPGIVLVKADGSVVKTGNSLPYEEEDAIFQATDDNFFLFKKQDEQKSKNARLRKVKRGELKPLPESKIQVEPSSVDFGVIKKGSEAKMEIKVTNISGQPVKLYQRSSCGCMNSTLKGKSTDPTLKPAESAVIEIQISTSNLAKRMATLKLTVFSPAEEEIIIPVKFEVIE